MSYVNIKDLRKQAVSSARAPHDTYPNTTRSKGSTKGWLEKDIQIFGTGFSDKGKEEFYLELGSMLAAGVDMRSALELIKSETKNLKRNKVFESILDAVILGNTLAEAIRKTDHFSSYEYFTIQLGEETGKLTSVLKELALYFNKRIRQKRQIIGALTYPIMVLLVAFSAIFFMVTYVVPMFSDIFRRSGDDLPAVTQLVITVSDFLRNSLGGVIIFLGALIGFALWQKEKVWFRNYATQALLRVPIWGRLIQRIYLGRLCHVLSMMLGSHIPILQAIQLVKQIIGFYPIEDALHRIEESMAAGKSLHFSMSQHPIFPAKMLAMIKVGEEVNQLHVFFDQLAEQYSNEIEHQTTMLSKFLEPFIIILLGCIVGVILIAMYLPLFKLGQQF